MIFSEQEKGSKRIGKILTIFHGDDELINRGKHHYLRIIVRLI